MCRSLVFFGGNDDRVRMNDTHILDTGEANHRKLSRTRTVQPSWLVSTCLTLPPVRAAETMCWSHYTFEPSPSVPSARSAHSSVILDGRMLLVFGGWDGVKEVGDLYAFNLGMTPVAALCRPHFDVFHRRRDCSHKEMASFGAHGHTASPSSLSHKCACGSTDVPVWWL